MTNHDKMMVSDTMERWENRGSIKIGRVIALAEMARNNIRPDGTFGDDECIIWEQFFLAKYNEC